MPANLQLQLSYRHCDSCAKLMLGYERMEKTLALPCTKSNTLSMLLAPARINRITSDISIASVSLLMSKLVSSWTGTSKKGIKNCSRKTKGRTIHY